MSKYNKVFSEIEKEFAYLWPKVSVVEDSTCFILGGKGEYSVYHSSPVITVEFKHEEEEGTIVYYREGKVTSIKVTLENVIDAIKSIV